MTNRIRKISAFNAVVGVLATTLLVSHVSAQAPRASTEQGVYQGQSSPHVQNVVTFKGIRFAAPPTGDLRWKPPQVPASFEGIAEAVNVGPACWQARNSFDSLYARGELERSEDCLYLNVYAPENTADESLPVMVWFHGGSNTAGHGGASAPFPYPGFIDFTDPAS